VICAVGIYTGSLAKMARDISLLMQGEVGEVADQVARTRRIVDHATNRIDRLFADVAAQSSTGWSPVSCSGCAGARARRRGWQRNGDYRPVIEATGLALESMTEVAEGWSVDASRMRANIEATGRLIFAERAMMLLGPGMGRDAAHKVLEEAVRMQVADVLASTSPEESGS